MMTEPEIATEPELEAPSEDAKESFGSWLRRQRELREITLREIADTSKISLRYLQALEEDRFDLLPAPVFAKGFLRQYARYVGIDPEETVNFFLTARGQEEEEVTGVAQRPPQTVATWSYVVVAIVVVVVLMAVVWGLLWLNRQRSEEAEEAPAGTAALTAIPSSGIPPSGAATAAGGEAEEAAAPEPPVMEPSVPAPSAPLLVTLDFSGNCWVRAAVDGERQEDRVYTQGESLQLEAQEFVELELGNVREVNAEVNGHRLPFDDRRGGSVRRLHIDLEMAASLAGENPAVPPEGEPLSPPGSG
jgi:cytoskeletal protein RodZ